MRRTAVLMAVAAVVAAFLPFTPAAALSLLLALGASLLVDATLVARAWRGRTLAALGVLGVLTSVAVASVAGPARGVAAGAAVLLRFLALLLLASLLARTVDADRIIAAARRVGLERLALVLGVALNTLPHMVDAARASWMALAARAGRRRPPLRLLPLLAETVLAHTARLAEDASVAAALRGHAALGRRTVVRRRLRALVVVTGPPDAGKTPVVADAAAALAAAGREVAGFVQEAVREGREKVGFTIRDLRTNETAPLARKVERGEGEHGTRFRFDPAGLAVGRRALRRAPRGCVLLVDELGPVELRGEGHMPALARAVQNLDGTLVCSVRSHLVPTVLAAFPAGEVTVVDVTAVSDPVAAILEAAVAGGGAGPPPPS